jgi:hypothetical protein
MNAGLLEIGVACPNPRRRLIICLTTLLLLTWCINNAHATAVTRTDTNNWFPNQAPASGDHVIVPSIGTCTATDECAMTPINDVLCHYRIRTRSGFNGSFQNDFTVAHNGRIPLNSSGIVAAKCETTQPVIFLNTATARGPPWSSNQSLYLSDNVLNRPASSHFSAAPLLSECQFHDSSSGRNTTRLLIQSSQLSGTGGSLVAAISQSNKTHPFTKRSNYEIQM